MSGRAMRNLPFSDMKASDNADGDTLKQLSEKKAICH